VLTLVFHVVLKLEEVDQVVDVVAVVFQVVVVDALVFQEVVVLWEVLFEVFLDVFVPTEVFHSYISQKPILIIRPYYPKFPI
jgi:hypothetical protein